MHSLVDDMVQADPKKRSAKDEVRFLRSGSDFSGGNSVPLAMLQLSALLYPLRVTQLTAPWPIMTAIPASPIHSTLYINFLHYPPTRCTAMSTRCNSSRLYLLS